MSEVCAATHQPCAMRRTLAAAILLAGLAAGSGNPAQAQSAVALGNYVAVEDDAKTVTPLSLTVAEIEGMDIFYETRKIAEVEEVLADPSGNVVAVVAEYGAVFGLGGKNVVLPLDRLAAKEGYLLSSLPPEQLESLPAWE